MWIMQNKFCIVSQAPLYVNNLAPVLVCHVCSVHCSKYMTISVAA